MKETIDVEIFAEFSFGICPKIAKLNSAKFFKEEPIVKTNFAKKIPFCQIVNTDYRIQTKLQALFSYLFLLFLSLGCAQLLCMHANIHINLIHYFIYQKLKSTNNLVVSKIMKRSQRKSRNHTHTHK